jgi:hypothetical protein
VNSDFHLQGLDTTPIETLGVRTLLLSPGKRLFVGLVLIALGAALLFDPRGCVLPELAYAVFVLGAGAMASALAARRAQRRLQGEFTAVLARWDELRAGVDAAERAGSSAVRYLQGQGISRFEVRRFVLARLRGDTTTGSDSRQSARTRAAADDERLAPHLRSGPNRAAPPWRQHAPGPRWLP